ncbi:hypothetical protein ACFL1S_08635 [Pseudomonadota bacterium]
MRVGKPIQYILAILSVLSVYGCVTTKSYVDPSFEDATYDAIKPVASKYVSKVEVEFQRNGERVEEAEKEVRNHVERTLRATGVIDPSASDTAITIKVVVNNIADLGEARAKGFGTGLTFGAAGSVVTDYYEVSISFLDGEGAELTENYKHALHSTIGNKKAPIEGVEPTTPADGFGTIVEQVLLNFVKDMQSKGLLSSTHFVIPWLS